MEKRWQKKGSERNILSERGVAAVQELLLISDKETQSPRAPNISLAQLPYRIGLAIQAFRQVIISIVPIAFKMATHSAFFYGMRRRSGPLEECPLLISTNHRNSGMQIPLKSFLFKVSHQDI